jgi:uncharacterized protein YpmS
MSLPSSFPTSSAFLSSPHYVPISALHHSQWRAAFFFFLFFLRLSFVLVFPFAVAWPGTSQSRTSGKERKSERRAGAKTQEQLINETYAPSR